MEETKLQRGVVGIVRNHTGDGSILFPLITEGDKKELVIGYGNRPRKLVSSMLEMVSGAVDPTDINEEEAIKRELGEERGLRKVSVEGPVDAKLEVHQQRGDAFVDFSVVMFLISLNEKQQEELVSRDRAVVYSDEFLLKNLSMMSEDSFRPLAWVTMQLAANNNFWK